MQQVLSRSGLREEKEHFGQLLGLEITTEELELGGHERNCVKLRGIPYSATPDDVVKFFGDLNEDIEVHGIHMVLSSVVSVVNLVGFYHDDHLP